MNLNEIWIEEPFDVDCPAHWAAQHEFQLRHDRYRVFLDANVEAFQRALAGAQDTHEGGLKGVVVRVTRLSP